MNLAYIINADMRYLNFKRLVIPEVVLLVILIIGLIISQTLVLRRSYIKLSQPHEVPASGFSFCMPAESGWQVMPAARYTKNSWFITGVKGGGERAATRLTVSYVLAGGQTDPNRWLLSQAALLGETMTYGRIIKGKGIEIHAGIVDLGRQPLNLFYGIALLPQGRSVTLELLDNTDDPQWGWSILTRVAESFAFKGNPLLEQGQKVITSMRKKGIAQFIPQQQQDYFLISSDGQPEGFNVEMLAQADGKKLMNVRAVNSHFILNAGGRESILQASDNLETFLWMSSVLGPAGSHREAIQVKLDVDATMSVRQQGQPEIENYVPGPASIPEPFSNAVFRQMAAEKITGAMIDFIGPEGQIMPSVVELQNQPKEANALPQKVNVWLLAEESTTQIFLDPQGAAEKFVVSGRTPYVLTKSTKKNVINEFPSWMEYITNLDKLLRQNMEDTQKTKRIVRDGGKFI